MRAPVSFASGVVFIGYALLETPTNLAPPPGY